MAIVSGWRSSRHKRHVVKHIVAPGSGVAIEDRPPVPSVEELQAERDARSEEKKGRRELKRSTARVERGVGLADKVIAHARKEFALHKRLLGGMEGAVEGGQKEAVSGAQ